MRKASYSKKKNPINIYAKGKKTKKGKVDYLSSTEKALGKGFFSQAVRDAKSTLTAAQKEKMKFATRAEKLSAAEKKERAKMKAKGFKVSRKAMKKASGDLKAVIASEKKKAGKAAKTKKKSISKVHSAVMKNSGGIKEKHHSKGASVAKKKGKRKVAKKVAKKVGKKSTRKVAKKTTKRKGGKKKVSFKTKAKRKQILAAAAAVATATPVKTKKKSSKKKTSKKKTSKKKSSKKVSKKKSSKKVSKKKSSKKVSKRKSGKRKGSRKTVKAAVASPVMKKSKPKRKSSKKVSKKKTSRKGKRKASGKKKSEKALVFSKKQSRTFKAGKAKFKLTRLNPFGGNMKLSKITQEHLAHDLAEAGGLLAGGAAITGVRHLRKRFAPEISTALEKVPVIGPFMVKNIDTILPITLGILGHKYVKNEQVKALAKGMIGASVVNIGASIYAAAAKMVDPTTDLSGIIAVPEMNGIIAVPSMGAMRMVNDFQGLGSGISDADFGSARGVGLDGNGGYLQNADFDSGSPIVKQARHPGQLNGMHHHHMNEEYDPTDF